MISSPDKSSGHAFNVGNPENNIQISHLAQLMIELYSKMTGEPKGTTRIVSGEVCAFLSPSHAHSSHMSHPILPIIIIRIHLTILPQSHLFICLFAPLRSTTGGDMMIPIYGSLR